MKFQKSGYLPSAIAIVLLSLSGLQAANGADWAFATTVGTPAAIGSAGLTLTGISTSSSTGATSSLYNNAGLAAFAAATVKFYDSGLGLVKGTADPDSTGPHAIDNVNGTDAIILGFGSTKVNLSSLQIGWNGFDNCTADGTTIGCGSGKTGTEVTTAYKGYNDSDLSVFAWMGDGPVTAAPTMTSLGFAVAGGAVTNGWKLIGNYGDVGNTANSGNVKGTQSLVSQVYSSNWLISAYNAKYGDATSGTVGGFNDAFKLMAVSGGSCTQDLTGNSCGPGVVPEPGGLALLGLGLVGLLTTQNARRRRANGGPLATIS